MRITALLVIMATALGCMGSAPGMMNNDVEETNARVARLEQQLAGLQQYVAGLYAALAASGALNASQPGKPKPATTPRRSGSRTATAATGPALERVITVAAAGRRGAACG